MTSIIETRSVFEQLSSHHQLFVGIRFALDENVGVRVNGEEFASRSCEQESRAARILVTVDQKIVKSSTTESCYFNWVIFL